jgi:HD-like signal output (HDOD) protein
VLTSVAISGDRNAIKKEAEKILNCKDITNKIQDRWNVKSKVIPVIKGQLEPSQNHQENI